MENGDLGSFVEEQRYIVLEGVLCNPVEGKSNSFRKLFKGTEHKWTDAGQWDWQAGPIKSLQDLGRFNIHVTVITFLDEVVAELAADWFGQYGINAEVEYVDYDWFCRSLTWRPDVASVVDTNMDRAMNYGQKGIMTTYGTVF